MSVKPDSQQWYHWIPVNMGSNGSVTTGCNYPGPGYCSIYAVPYANASTPEYQWQFYQNSDNNYTIRNKVGGPSAYMAVYELLHNGNPIYGVQMQPMSNWTTTWAFGTWQTGHFYLYSALLGSSYRLSLEDYGDGQGSWMWMNPNTTDTPAGNLTREWDLAPRVSIADTQWSTLSAVATSTTTTSPVTASSSTPTAASTTIVAAASTTSSVVLPATTAAASSMPISTTSTSHNLSIGAEAGLGAGIGIAALALILACVWLLLRRRRRSKQTTYTHLLPDMQKHALAETTEIESSDAHEAYGMPLSELSGRLLPAELAGEPTKLRVVH